MLQLPKIVRSRLAANSPDHPDPDLLTGFLEGNLLDIERAIVLKHLSQCSDCRQVIALASPEFASARDFRLLPQRVWFRLPVLRWGALAACVAIVGTAVVLHQRSKPVPAAEVAMQTGAPPVRTDVVRSQQELAQAGHARDLDRKSLSRSSAARAAAGNAPSAESAPPAAPSASDSSLAKEKATVPKPAQEGRLQAEAKASARAANGVVFIPRPTTETAASTMGGAKLTDLQPPRWRLSGDGLPERSLNNGSWEKLSVDHASGFRALASQNMEVWLGGPSGLLYHSDDMGLHWNRFSPANAGSLLSDDITQLDFLDHLHVTLTTATGAKWVTSDAGKTWAVK